MVTLRESKLKDGIFILIQKILPQHALSRWVGRLAMSEKRWLKNLLIRAAIRRFKIDLHNARIRDPYHYKSFNAFFTRELFASATTLFPELPAMGSPAEGVVSQVGKINQGDLIQAKAKQYSVHALLAAHSSSALFMQGSFTTIYLAPHNYHRVHCPVEGQLTEITYVPGKLFSVNLLTADHIDTLFARNERMIFHINTAVGKVALVMVGALLVAGMKTPFKTWTRLEMKSLQSVQFQSPIQLKPGDELGYFEFGSTVVLCFENSNLNWCVPENTSVTLGEQIASYSALL